MKNRTVLNNSPKESSTESRANNPGETTIDQGLIHVSDNFVNWLSTTDLYKDD